MATQTYYRWRQMLGIKGKVEWETVWQFLKKFNNSYHMKKEKEKKVTT